jgi:hypothetical protein
MDFSNQNDYIRLLQMLQEGESEEAREVIHEGLAELAEVWIGDTNEDRLARSFISAFRAFVDAAMSIDSFDGINPHVLGLWVHAYQRNAKDFMAFAGLTQVKKSFEQKKKGD